jgi:hypothetical protein
MAGMLRVPRSRGALSGVFLVLLGAWGALIPFIGPYFHYAYTPDTGWIYTTGRLWLEILPGAATLLGGLIVLTAVSRPAALFGAWLAAMSGAWFVVGKPLSTLWTTGAVPAAGSPVGGTITRAVEQIGFFGGLGAAIIFFAALALGRFTVVGHREAVAAQEAAMAERTAADQAMAGRASDRMATDRMATGRTTTDRMATDQTTAGPTTAGPTTAGPTTAGPTTADRATADPTTADRATADRATANRMAADRATADRTTVDQTTADRDTVGQAPTEQIATPPAETDPAMTAGAPARGEQVPGPRTVR